MTKGRAALNSGVSISCRFVLTMEYELGVTCCIDHRKGTMVLQRHTEQAAFHVTTPTVGKRLDVSGDDVFGGIP